MSDEQKCIADLVELVYKLSNSIRKGDLSAVRKGSCVGGGINLGVPLFCRRSDELFEKHGDVIHVALRAKEREAGNEQDKRRQNAEYDG